MKSDYDIIEIKKDNINLIKNLWEKNRIFHQNKTSNFSYQYSNLNFDERMNNIFNSKNIKYYKIFKGGVMEKETKRLLRKLVRLFDGQTKEYLLKYS